MGVRRRPSPQRVQGRKCRASCGARRHISCDGPRDCSAAQSRLSEIHLASATMRRALARGDSSAWLNAQLAGERAVIPLAARTINRDAVSGRESSSALTLKDTCAETVNVSVTDGLASDTSVTTALTRNTTRPGIQGGRQDLAAGAPGRLRYLTVTSNVRGAVVLTGRRRFPMEPRAPRRPARHRRRAQL